MLCLKNLGTSLLLLHWLALSTFFQFHSSIIYDGFDIDHYVALYGKLSAQ